MKKIIEVDETSCGYCSLPLTAGTYRYEWREAVGVDKIIHFTEFCERIAIIRTFNPPPKARWLFAENWTYGTAAGQPRYEDWLVGWKPCLENVIQKVSGVRHLYHAGTNGPNHTQVMVRGLWHDWLGRLTSGRYVASHEKWKYVDSTYDYYE